SNQDEALLSYKFSLAQCDVLVGRTIKSQASPGPPLHSNPPPRCLAVERHGGTSDWHDACAAYFSAASLRRLLHWLACHRVVWKIAMIAISGSNADGVAISALHDTLQRQTAEVPASLRAKRSPEDLILLGPPRGQIAVRTGTSKGQLRNTAGACCARWSVPLTHSGSPTCVTVTDLRACPILDPSISLGATLSKPLPQQ